MVERPGESLTDTLAEVLRARQLLLVVDNCEHLMEATAGFVDSILDSCPRVRILATSREALGVEGEARWLVPPLSVPDSQRKPSPEELGAYESVRLFVERARGRDPSFSLNPRNAPAVAKICRMLEGIPLAIELAAARVGMLSLEQISQRLTDSLSLLTSGSKTQVPKQRTLRGTLDWSHDLLSEVERRHFGRLSVFAGGWDLTASEAVAAGEVVEEVENLDLLSGLVEKSLVVTKERDEGAVRYRMLEPVRQYAREKLEEADEGEEIRHQHAEFFLALAEEAEPGLRGPQDREWLELLEAEHDNMRAALSWALEREEVELGLLLGGALGTFWNAHGHLGEGRRWLEAALGRGAQASVVARLRALKALYWVTLEQWDNDRAEAVAQEAMELSAEVDIDSSLAASLRIMLAAPAWVGGDYERGKVLLEESLVISREADDKVKIAEALFQLGGTTHSLGDIGRAKEIYEEGIAVCREVGYTYRLPWFLHSLGYMLMLEGDYARGAALNEEAAALCREHGYKAGSQYALDNLGWAALLQRDHERARAFYKESLLVCRELGDRMIASVSLEGLACVAGANGNDERAGRLFGAAQALHVREAVAFEHTPQEDAWLELGCTHSTGQLRKATSLEIGCRVTSVWRRRDCPIGGETTPGSSNWSVVARRPPARSAPLRSAASTTSQRASSCGGDASTTLAEKRLSAQSNPQATRLWRRG